MIRCLILFSLLFLSCSPLLKYDTTGDKWEEEIKKLEALDQKESYSDKAILFIGSSSIRLWNSIKKDLYPYEPIRRGYGGAHYYDLIHFTERLVAPHDISAIAIFVANDITGKKKTPKRGLRKDLKPKEVLRLAKFITRQIRKSHKSIPVFFIETTPTSSRWNAWPEISTANDLIKGFTIKKKNMFFIDTRTQYIKSDGLPNDDYFIKDKLHLNNKGYQLWGKIIRENFNKKLNFKK